MAKRILVIGAVALGPKAASRCKRLMPDAEVTLIDQSSRISYGGCGIPYFISDEVKSVAELQSTPYGAVRNEQFFEVHKDIRVLTNCRATRIDKKEKTVVVQNLMDGSSKTLAYDSLVLALGSSPNRPRIPGIELQGISPATNLDEAEYIKSSLHDKNNSHVVVVGGGFIGLELAVAIGETWGIPTSVIEIAPQVLPNFLSSGFARMAQHDLASENITVYTDEKVVRFEGENGRVSKVVTDKREIPAELVILSAGVHPNTDIAKEAGLAVTEKGLLVVDEHMRTSDPDIYAGGDCVTIPNQVTGKPGWYPLGSMANRQGRVIGTNISGGNERFPGAVGAWGVKLCSLNAAGAGLTLESALREGFDAISVQIVQADRAHFFPTKTPMSMELVVDRQTRRVLGVQGISTEGDALAARINPVAALLSRNAEVSDISNLEVLYSPPFASAMDIVNTLGNAADNVLSGSYKPMTLEEFDAAWANREKEDFYLLDTRPKAAGAAFEKKFPGLWHNIPQDEVTKRLAEIPADKPVIITCNSGLRAYEAQLVLTNAGRTNTKAVFGGVTASARFGTKF
ncbi:FAD-dependent oxidoreductase [Desulfovibrio sp. OttesenSCG-928-O18]|nr:FAD-dependent oxidoreductase [Desulfovibrio sp. OttesenSCG-928-O18]